MPKTFQVHVSDGKDYQIKAQGYADAAVALLSDPTRYPLPNRAVVGIEGPKGAARFYLKREDNRNLWPISVNAAAVELAMIAK